MLAWLIVDDVRLEGSYCAQCGQQVDEAADAGLSDRRPCRQCGSLLRNRKVSARDTLTFHESIGLVQRQAAGPNGGKGRRVLEIKSGEFPSADGTWSFVVQIVDRLHNRYRKFVQRADGRVDKDIDGRLSDHQGFGSAKIGREEPPKDRNH